QWARPDRHDADDGRYRGDLVRLVGRRAYRVRLRADPLRGLRRHARGRADRRRRVPVFRILAGQAAGGAAADHLRAVAATGGTRRGARRAALITPEVVEHSSCWGVREAVLFTPLNQWSRPV